MYRSRLFKSSHFNILGALASLMVIGLVVITLLAAGCRSRSQSQIYNNDRLDALESMIREDPGLARDSIVQRLNGLLVFTANGSQSANGVSSTSLLRLVSLYSTETGAHDLDFRLRLIQSLDLPEARQKLDLDSLFAKSSKSFSRGRADSLQSAASEYLTVLDSLEEAYSVIGDTLGVASVRRYRATTLEEIGLTSDAKSAARAADSVARTIGALEVSGDAHLLLARIAAVYEGNQFRADLHVQEAVRLYRQIRKQDRIVYPLAYQAYTAYQRGSYELARHSFEAALKGAQSRRSPEMAMMEAYCMGQLAEIYLDLGILDSATAWCQKSQLLRECLNDVAQVAHSISTHGVILQSQEKYFPALSTLSRASDLFHLAGDSLGILLNDGRHGELLLDIGRYEKADSLFRNVVNNAAKFESRYRALLGLGTSALYQRDYQAARKLFRECVYQSEQLRQGLPTVELREGVLSDRTGAYYGLASTFLHEYLREPNVVFIDSAINLMELARARSLLDVTDQGRKKCGGEEELLEQISNLRVSLMYDSSSGLTGRDSLQQLMDSLHTIRLFCGDRRDNDHARAEVTNSTITTRTLMERLGPAEAVLYYCLSADEHWLIAVRHADISVVRLCSTSGKLNQLVTDLRRSIDHYPTVSEYQIGYQLRCCENLYNAIIPLSVCLSDIETLYILASGPLQGIPFGALVDSAGAWLTENYTIVYPPSLTVALSNSVDTSNIVKENRTLVFANATESAASEFVDLPFAERELHALQKVFGANVVTSTGQHATEAKFRSNLKEPWKRLHIALHGISFPADPSRSALVFAPAPPDTFPSMLNSDEIGSMQIDVSQVFLSACESGAGQVLEGEGVMSMARAFLLAGAKSVVSSAWRVDDRASAEFASSYYGAIAAGHSPRQALRSAQLHMINSDRPLYRHPYFWASYLLQETNWQADGNYHYY